MRLYGEYGEWPATQRMRARSARPQGENVVGIAGTENSQTHGGKLPAATHFPRGLNMV